MGVRVVVLCSYPHAKGHLSCTTRYVRWNGVQMAFRVFICHSEREMPDKFLTLFKPFGVDIRRQCAQDAYEDCLQRISDDGKAVPAHQRDWKIGQSFSWHYVKIVEYRVNQFSTELESMIMAKKTSKGQSTNAFPTYEFVRCELNSEDKKSAKIWIEENTAELGALLHDAMASDYKYTCSFSSEHDTFTACLVGKEDNPINPRKTLTARHKDWVVAALTVLYKHQVMFKSGVWEQPLDNADDGWA